MWPFLHALGLIIKDLAVNFNIFQLMSINIIFCFNVFEISLRSI